MVVISEECKQRTVCHGSPWSSRAVNIKRTPGPPHQNSHKGQRRTAGIMFKWLGLFRLPKVKKERESFLMFKNLKPTVIINQFCCDSSLQRTGANKLWSLQLNDVILAHTNYRAFCLFFFCVVVNLTTDVQWGQTFGPHIRAQHHRFPSWLFSKANVGL